MAMARPGGGDRSDACGSSPASLIWPGRTRFRPPSAAQLPSLVPSQPGDPDWVPCPYPAIVLDRFAFNSDKPTPAHLPIIRQVARRIFESRNDPIPVHFVCIEGHTDPSGNKAYNQALGKRRADNVQQLLEKALDDIQPGLSRSGQFGMWAIVRHGRARMVARPQWRPGAEPAG